MMVWTKPEVISMKDMSNEFKTFIVIKSDINSSLWSASKNNDKVFNYYTDAIIFNDLHSY